MNLCLGDAYSRRVISTDSANTRAFGQRLRQTGTKQAIFENRSLILIEQLSEERFSRIKKSQMHKLLSGYDSSSREPAAGVPHATIP